MRKLQVILRGMLRCDLDSNDSGYDPVVVSCQRDDEPLGSVKTRNLLTS
jgi:hypothetical protein